MSQSIHGANLFKKRQRLIAKASASPKDDIAHTETWSLLGSS